MTVTQRLDVSEGIKKADWLKLQRLESAEVQRQFPLRLKGYACELVKETAQEIADHLWMEDVANEIRITEMANKVYPKLVAEIESGIAEYTDPIKEGHVINAIRKAIPKTAAGLKPWLREIMPEYAFSRGKPKNKI